MQLARRSVGINGQEQRVLAAIDVGDIDGAVGADKTVAGFGDEHSVLAADDGDAFAQGELNDARIEVILFGPRDGVARWLDGGEIDDAAFSFGDDFVLHDEDVAVLQGKMIFAERI